jgi:hypothetical protein
MGLKVTQTPGTWELVSFGIIAKDGRTSPWDKNVAGLLIYAGSGAVSTR